MEFSMFDFLRELIVTEDGVGKADNNWGGMTWTGQSIPYDRDLTDQISFAI